MVLKEVEYKTEGLSRQVGFFDHENSTLWHKVYAKAVLSTLHFESI